MQLQPSEFAKLALVLWGADLLARKERLRQLEDWRHLLIPLLPGAGLLALMVMVGDDLGTTFVLLIIFITLLWVIGTPGRIFGGMLALMGLVLLLLAVIWFVLVWSVMASNPLVGFSDAVKIQVRTG